jgi:hypothetical protein
MWNFKILVCSKSGLEVYNLLTVKRQLRKGDFNSSPSPKDQQEEDTNKNNWKKKIIQITREFTFLDRKVLIPCISKLCG